MGYLRYLARRLVITVVLIWAVASFLFLVFRLMPGDYATLLAQQGAGPETAARLRELWGLDEPIHIQYLVYLQNTATLDLGQSHVTSQPVWTYVQRPMANSIILVMPAVILAYVVGSMYGAVLGVKQDSWLDKFGIIPPIFIGTTPAFFFGILLLFAMVGYLGLFPVQGMLSLDAYRELGQSPPLIDIYTHPSFWYHYTLPFLTVFLTFLYIPTIVMRTSVVEVSGQDFSYFHRIKGLSPVDRYRHTLRHASLPVVTLLPSSLVQSISGLVTIEVVFNWPGIGNLLVASVVQRDTPVIQFVFVLIAVGVIFGNFLVDIFYTVIDPRVTVGGD